MNKEIISSRIFSEKYLNDILLTLKLWENNITNINNFSVIKFGDGELISMMGKEKRYNIYDTHNCDGHSFDDYNLGQKLLQAWDYFNEYNNIYNNIYCGMDNITFWWYR
jgi:hypothetical protein